MISIEYCEKAAYAGFFEPINFISNFFIIIGALFVLRYVIKNGIKDIKSKVYIALGILTGLGSMSWHFYQTGITLLLDVLPIMILVLMSLYFILLKATKSKVVSMIALSILFLSIYYFEMLVRFVFGLTFDNGPPFYGIIPVLLIYSGILAYKEKETFKKFLLPFVFFGLAILFRQIDLLVCNVIPFGTHFLWHFFNSFALYYLYLTYGK